MTNFRKKLFFKNKWKIKYFFKKQMTNYSEKHVLKTLLKTIEKSIKEKTMKKEWRLKKEKWLLKIKSILR